MFRLNDLAYTKLVVHALKYPHKTVNGLLLGQHSSSDGFVDIVDAVPLQHHWTNLSPMMEVGLGMTANYAHSRQLHIVGFYEAPERVGDTTLSRVAECVIGKIKETNFPTPVALVLDGSKLGEEGSTALVPYTCVANNFRRADDKLKLNKTIPTRALHLVRQSNILNDFWDFDNYLEDNRAPFLTNGAVGTALIARQ